MTRSDFLKSLKTLIEYHRICGIRSYPGSAEILNSLHDITLKSAGEASDEPAGSVSGERDETAPVVGTATPASEKSQPIEELTELITVCTICPLHQGRQIATPGNGGHQPQLLVVGDWLLVPDDQEPRADLVFGAEQDAMLEKMMAAIGLSRDAVYVTNMIKCSVPESIQPGAEHIGVCINYLKQQITLLSPRLICAMGSITAQTLLATPKSLSQLRGRFHTCNLPPVLSVPVMPTYHPSYLLKNPEMKRAAWSDLQMIQKKMDKKPAS